MNVATTTGSTTIEFWFDFASTYSYLGAMQIQEAAWKHGCALRWRPFLLGAIFKKQGWNDSPFNIYPVKGRYMWRDMERLCATYKISFRKPSRFPRDGLLAARIACMADENAWLAEFVRKVFVANFAQDLDIAEPSVLHECLRGLVNNPATVLAAARNAEAKSRLRRNTDRAIELGIFGAPTFVVGDELFWGSDRLEAALQWSNPSSAKVPIIEKHSL